MADNRRSGNGSTGTRASESGGGRGSGGDRGSSGSPGDGRAQTSDDQVRALYEQAESSAAKAFDEFVAKPSFGAMLARSAENVAALSRMGADFADLVLRNLRIAGRADITRLARQLNRTEDKLERVLQEIEQLRDEVSQPSSGSRRSNGREAKTSARSKAQS